MRSVSIANRHPQLKVDRRAVARMIAVLDANCAAIGLAPSAVPAGELSVVFLTDAALAALHADFLDDPSPTDVITFAGNAALGSAGEICVSADTAARYARRHGGDLGRELALYVVHGWLHLAGHDDLQPAKKRAMRRAEARAFRELARAGAAPSFSMRAASPAPRRAGRPARGPAQRRRR